MSEFRKTPPDGSGGGGVERIQGHPTRQDAEKERLQDELADLLFRLDGTASGVEALDSLLDRLEEISPSPDSLLSDTKEELERFHRQYASVFTAVAAAAPAPPSPAPSGRRVHRPLARLLPIAAVLLLLFSTVTAQAFGADVFSVFARWTSEIFRLDDSSAFSAYIRIRPLEEGETAYYGSLEEALDAFGIDAPVAPKDIPERFELVEVMATQSESGLRLFANYEGNGDSLRIRYKEESIDIFALEKEYGDVDFYFAGSIEHYFLEDLDRLKITWQNGDIECLISGDVSEEELKAMIDSIYEE